MLNKKLGWIKTNLDNKIYIALKNVTFNLICQYTVAAVKMTNKKIFCVPLQGIIYFMQSFIFDKLTSKIKKQLVILEDVSNFQIVNLKAYNNYDSKTLLPVFSLTTKINFSNDSNSKPESTPEPNIGVQDKFITIAVKKESVYIAAVKDNKWQRIYKIALKTVTLM